ncbi:MAG: HepT-like ribonuclease domain-containing protein [Blastocatellia bacterium]
MKSRHDRLYLYDIIECCDRVADYVNGVREEDYQVNPMLQDALVRNIEVVGEAVKNLSSEITDAYPNIAWSQIARMRDKIAHHYFRINLDVVWKTATEDLPNLRPQIAAIYESIGE